MPGLEKVNVPARLFCQNTANQRLPEWLHPEVYFVKGELRHVQQAFSCSSSRT